jgi:hypothetical protein
VATVDDAQPPVRVPARLRELNPDVRAAVLLSEEGELAGCSEDDAGRAGELAEAARELLRAVDRAAGDPPPAELEAQVLGGSVFAVRRPPWALLAVARRSALSSLMLYDLRAVLGELTGDPPTGAAA